MKSNTQNAKIEAITEKTLVLGIDVGSETHYLPFTRLRNYSEILSIMGCIIKSGI